jgi:hypothetical protein
MKTVGIILMVIFGIAFALSVLLTLILALSKTILVLWLFVPTFLALVIYFIAKGIDES